MNFRDDNPNRRYCSAPLPHGRYCGVGVYVGVYVGVGILVGVEVYVGTGVDVARNGVLVGVHGVYMAVGDGVHVRAMVGVGVDVDVELITELILARPGPNVNAVIPITSATTATARLRSDDQSTGNGTDCSAVIISRAVWKRASRSFANAHITTASSSVDTRGFRVEGGWACSSSTTKPVDESGVSPVSIS